jgi:transposase-like protein
MAAEKVRMVEETFEPGMTVSLVARWHGVAWSLAAGRHVYQSIQTRTRSIDR